VPHGPGTGVGAAVRAAGVAATAETTGAVGVAAVVGRGVGVGAGEVLTAAVWAEVVVVGPHVRGVEPGDSVLFNPEDRYEVEVRGEEYIILRERDIHAVASERIEGGTGLYL